jgi:hypothetical protein
VSACYFFPELSLIVVLETGIITTVVLFCTGLLAQLGSQAPSRQQLLDIETRLRSLQSKVSALCLNTSTRVSVILFPARSVICHHFWSHTIRRWYSC